MSIADLIAEAVKDTSERTVALTELEFKWLLNAAKLGANWREEKAIERQAHASIAWGYERAKAFQAQADRASAEHSAYWALINKVSSNRSKA